ncbi:MAG: bifunctional O-acetylhomoserine aminocarboxypropyltransferase/cysteine synthase, partial [Chitinophagaceae bacterium]|nr:bifunctional O-acetylhomoserine aminocarboxypropyltransferase/cysteine synthase [Anaerolineae bacterium]
MSHGRATDAIHGKKDPSARPVTYPIYQTTAFAVESSDDYAHVGDFRSEDYFYTR